MLEPMFTAAVTFACCNLNAPGWISGGMWIIEPSHVVAADIDKLINNPVPGTEALTLPEQIWKTSDLGVAQHAFTKALPMGKAQPMYPSLESEIHGIVPGLEFLPEAKLRVTPQDEEIYMNGRVPKEKRGRIGLMRALWKPGVSAGAHRSVCYA